MKQIYWIRTHKYDDYHRFDWNDVYDYPVIDSYDFKYCLIKDKETGYYMVQDVVSSFMVKEEIQTSYTDKNKQIIDAQCK